MTDTASLVFSIQWLHRGHGANDSSPYRRHKSSSAFSRPRSHSAVLLLQQHACEIIYLGMDGDHRESWLGLIPLLDLKSPWLGVGGGIAVLRLWMKSYSKHELNETIPFFLSPKVTIELQWNECLLENGSSLHSHLTKLVIWTCTPLRRVLFLRTYTSLLLFLQTQCQAEQPENRVLICGSDSECASNLLISLLWSVYLNTCKPFWASHTSGQPHARHLLCFVSYRELWIYGWWFPFFPTNVRFSSNLTKCE